MGAGRRVRDELARVERGDARHAVAVAGREPDAEPPAHAVADDARGLVRRGAREVADRGEVGGAVGVPVVVGEVGEQLVEAGDALVVAGGREQGGVDEGLSSRSVEHVGCQDDVPEVGDPGRHVDDPGAQPDGVHDEQDGRVHSPLTRPAVGTRVAADVGADVGADDDGVALPRGQVQGDGLGACHAAILPARVRRDNGCDPAAAGAARRGAQSTHVFR